MGYYIRVLSANLLGIPVEELQEAADPAVVEGMDDDSGEWTELLLKHKSGSEIAVIERNLVAEGQLGAGELQEFIDEIPHYEPKSAVDWLLQLLPNTKVIYAFQLLSGTDIEDGWTPLHSVYSRIWNLAGGILQADGEGFSNLDGYTILWQFSESTTGSWNMGIRDVDGKWVHFEMDLGDLNQRDAFKRGEVPAGAKILK